MTTYTLTVSTDDLGLGVIDGGQVTVTRKRATAADQYPPVNALYEITTATDADGIATAELKADDSSTYHVCRVWDADGAVVYQQTFSMPPDDGNLADLSEAVIGASNIQFKDEGASRGTPSTTRNVNFTGADVSATFSGETLTVNVDSSATAETAVSTHVAASDPHGDRAYAESLVVGLWNDRGNFDASVNAYPSSGGSGTAGAIRKGDIWTVSVAGTLPTAQIVEAGDTVRALVNAPGNTQANWAIQQNNIGYVPENSANKSTDGTMADNSATKYPSQAAVVIYTAAQIGLSVPPIAQVAQDFEDFRNLSGNSTPDNNNSLRVRTDSMTISSQTSAKSLASIGATNTIGVGMIYSGNLSAGAVAAAQEYFGFAKLPSDCKKEAIFSVGLDVLPTNTSTTDGVFRFGFGYYGWAAFADPLGAANASAYFQADKDNLWKCCSGKTGANETTTTAVAVVADTLYALNVIIASNGVVAFYIDGVLVATHNTGLCNYEQPWFKGVSIYNRGAGTITGPGGIGGLGTIWIDYWGQRTTLSSTRTNAVFRG